MSSIFHDEHNYRLVQQWWAGLKSNLLLLDRLVTASPTDLSRFNDIDKCITTLQMQFDHLRLQRYPASAEAIRRYVLAIFTNLIASLQHQRLGNNDECGVLFDLATVEKSMLDTCLLEFDITL